MDCRCFPTIKAPPNGIERPDYQAPAVLDKLARILKNPKHLGVEDCFQNRMSTYTPDSTIDLASVLDVPAGQNRITTAKRTTPGGESGATTDLLDRTGRPLASVVTSSDGEIREMDTYYYPTGHTPERFPLMEAHYYCTAYEKRWTMTSRLAYPTYIDDALGRVVWPTVTVTYTSPLEGEEPAQLESVSINNTNVTPGVFSWNYQLHSDNNGKERAMFNVPGYRCAYAVPTVIEHPTDQLLSLALAPEKAHYPGTADITTDQFTSESDRFPMPFGDTILPMGFTTRVLEFTEEPEWMRE